MTPSADLVAIFFMLVTLSAAAPLAALKSVRQRVHQPRSDGGVGSNRPVRSFGKSVK